MSEREMNLVLLGGRLVSEPDVRELQDGRPVCFLRVSCNIERLTLRSSCGRCEEFDVLVLGGKARRIFPYLHQGQYLLVQGSLEQEIWEEGEGPEQEGVCVLAKGVYVGGARPRGVRALRDRAYSGSVEQAENVLGAADRMRPIAEQPEGSQAPGVGDAPWYDRDIVPDLAGDVSDQ
jgi:single-stranded DNA-binding protein